MPSLVTTMAATPTVIATEKPNAKKKITSLIIDNVGGAAARTVQVQDRFTPSITNAVPVPAVQTPSRFSITIPNGAGNVWNFDETELRNVDVLGQLELIINVADAGCIVSIAWEHE
ncbi:hypothetical protein ES703_00337 [subsurface metagenome]